MPVAREERTLHTIATLPSLTGDAVPYASVDKLQNMLATEVFGYAADKKKASGRALGTLVEIMTFYTACAWGMRDAIAIEKPIPEFANPEITHNVEFSLHPIISSRAVNLLASDLPITSRKIIDAGGISRVGQVEKAQQVLSSNGVMRNAAVIAEGPRSFTTAHLGPPDRGGLTIATTELLAEPFAIFECKRVGVEEGMRKGPQTIEKAKQGAYVARSVSSLQKFRLRNGAVQGVLDLGEGALRTGNYTELLRQIIDGTDAEALKHFILTVGVVSNHGNWFTAENHNKELRVLAHSYDWLLFLTDAGLCQFIEKLLVNPVPELAPARVAFLASYNKDSAGNRFTKVKVDVEADAALKRYFATHEAEVEGWFNVISPRDGTVRELREDVVKLAAKNWMEIRHP